MSDILITAFLILGLCSLFLYAVWSCEREMNAYYKDLRETYSSSKDK